jgi:hypothetical protein
MKTLSAFILLGSSGLAGCEFAAGAATGALATDAGYEINSKRQMDKSKMTTVANVSAGEITSAGKIS